MTKNSQSLTWSDFGVQEPAQRYVALKLGIDIDCARRWASVGVTDIQRMAELKKVIEPEMIADYAAADISIQDALSLLKAKVTPAVWRAYQADDPNITVNMACELKKAGVGKGMLTELRKWTGITPEQIGYLASKWTVGDIKEWRLAGFTAAAIFVNGEFVKPDLPYQRILNACGIEAPRLEKLLRNVANAGEVTERHLAIARALAGAPGSRPYRGEYWVATDCPPEIVVGLSHNGDANTNDYNAFKRLADLSLSGRAQPSDEKLIELYNLLGPDNQLEFARMLNAMRNSSKAISDRWEKEGLSADDVRALDPWRWCTDSVHGSDPMRSVLSVMARASFDDMAAFISAGKMVRDAVASGLSSGETAERWSDAWAIFMNGCSTMYRKQSGYEDLKLRGLLELVRYGVGVNEWKSMMSIGITDVTEMRDTLDAFRAAAHSLNCERFFSDSQLGALKDPPMYSLEAGVDMDTEDDE